MWTIPRCLPGSGLKPWEDLQLWIPVSSMPMDKFANMDEKLWILEDLNMMYIRQIALSLQVKLSVSTSRCLILLHATCRDHFWSESSTLVCISVGIEYSNFHFIDHYVWFSGLFSAWNRYQTESAADPSCKVLRGVDWRIIQVDTQVELIPPWSPPFTDLSLTASRKQQYMLSLSPVFWVFFGSPLLKWGSHTVHSCTCEPHQSLWEPVCMCVCVYVSSLKEGMRFSLRHYLAYPPNANLQTFFSFYHFQ